MEFTTQLWAAFSNNPTHREKQHTPDPREGVGTSWTPREQIVNGIVTLHDASFQRTLICWVMTCVDVLSQDYNSEANLFGFTPAPIPFDRNPSVGW